MPKNNSIDILFCQTILTIKFERRKISGGTSLAGGVGSIWGTVIGALIIGVMNNGLTILGLSSFWQYVAKGAVIVLAVLLDKWRQQHSFN
jgi:ribose transport system permease protein